MSSGVLDGLRIIEIAGLGPGPFAAMMLADLGARVLRIERPDDADFGIARDPRFEVNRRGRDSIRIDLKSPQGAAQVLALVSEADALMEGFRPGVMERLGLGPEACLAVRPRLVYGRMTGWGQTGPLAMTAGHDINYLALSGALSLFGPADRPPPVPANFLGDYGGGGMLLAFGMVSAMLAVGRGTPGQVVDAAILDGVSTLANYVHGLRAGGYWSDEREANLVDGGAPFYATYETQDGRYVAVGAIEKRFYRALLDTLGLGGVPVASQHDRATWPALRARIADTFKCETQAHWVQRFDGVDACFSPVLTMEEAPSHPHVSARKTLIEIDGIVQAAPAPRFSRHQAETPQPARAAPDDADDVIQRWLRP